VSGLFGEGPQVLLDDATGRIEYRPGALAGQPAADGRIRGQSSYYSVTSGPALAARTVVSDVTE
jgi:hypothetical protein